MGPALNIQIVDTPFDPTSNERVVLTRTANGKPLYRVFVRLTGPDVPFLNRVTYFLHPTVARDPIVLTRTESNPDFRLVLWLWGTFSVRAVVEDSGRRSYELVHHLQFDAYFQREKFAETHLALRAG